MNPNVIAILYAAHSNGGGRYFPPSVSGEITTKSVAAWIAQANRARYGLRQQGRSGKLEELKLTAMNEPGVGPYVLITVQPIGKLETFGGAAIPVERPVPETSPGLDEEYLAELRRTVIEDE